MLTVKMSYFWNINCQNVDFWNNDVKILPNNDCQNVDFQNVDFQNVDSQNVDCQNANFKNIGCQNANYVCTEILTVKMWAPELTVKAT
jgi:uncharacterized protein YjbI with pentapeptide repeats